MKTVKAVLPPSLVVFFSCLVTSMVMRLYDACKGRAELRSSLAVYSAAREQPHIISVCGERQLSLEQIILAETFLLSKSQAREGCSDFIYWAIQKWSSLHHVNDSIGV